MIPRIWLWYRRVDGDRRRLSRAVAWIFGAIVLVMVTTPITRLVDPDTGREVIVNDVSPGGLGVAVGTGLLIVLTLGATHRWPPAILRRWYEFGGRAPIVALAPVVATAIPTAIVAWAVRLDLAAVLVALAIAAAGILLDRRTVPGTTRLLEKIRADGVANLERLADLGRKDSTDARVDRLTAQVERLADQVAQLAGADTYEHRPAAADSWASWWRSRPRVRG